MQVAAVGKYPSTSSPIIWKFICGTRVGLAAWQAEEVLAEVLAEDGGDGSSLVSGFSPWVKQLVGKNFSASRPLNDVSSNSSISSKKSPSVTTLPPSVKSRESSTKSDAIEIPPRLSRRWDKAEDFQAVGSIPLKVFEEAALISVPPLALNYVVSMVQDGFQISSTWGAHSRAPRGTFPDDASEPY